MFSSVVPACGSFLLRSQEVQESKSGGVGDSTPTTWLGPQTGGRHTAPLTFAPSVSFPRGWRIPCFLCMRPLSLGGACRPLACLRPSSYSQRGAHITAKLVVTYAPPGVSGNPLSRQWVPAFAGTTLLFIRSGGRSADAGFSPSLLLAFSTAKSREQSQNIYENKGQVQKVAELRIARANADRLGPQAGRQHTARRYFDCGIEGTKRECL